MTEPGPRPEVAVVERAFVRVVGPEAATYLQGQLSQDIAGLAPGESAPSFLLQPTGKVVALLRVIRADHEQYDLLTDVEAAEDVVRRLRRYLLRTQAEVLDPTTGSCTVVFGGPSLPQALRTQLWPASDRPAPQEIVGLAPDVQDGAVDLTPAEFEQRRIAAGVPVSAVDIGENTIPGEVGAWAIEAAVSFTKGCYTGQELVARIDSRGGNVPRPLRGVVALDGQSMSTGTEVVVDGKAAGRITSAAGLVGMAPVARAVVPPAAATADGRPVEIRAFPLEV